MLKKLLSYLIGGLFLITFTPLSTQAQSDGPRSQLPSPTDVWAINIKYLNLDQDILPSGNLLLKNANITVNVFPITLIHTFTIGHTWARIFIMAAPVSSFSATTKTLPTSINNIQKSGFSDGWVTLEVGLIGKPALNIIQFSQQPPAKFTLNGQFRVWYSGSYDANNLVNLGSNRTTFDLGLPMAIRLNNDTKKVLWLETWPGIQFFTDNNDPAKLSRASEISQHPLFYMENHLSYNFDPKFYAGIDFRFQQGGQTLNDGVENNNTISIIAGGPFVGYKFLPFADFYANYGRIFAGDNDARSRMIRLNLVISYVNVKKYKKPSQ